ncbi:hypothetical protein ACHAXN_003463 [Cyclotella atomus]
MAVDGYGGKFHQYDLSVDGMSYFSMPAVYELGTEKMWRKVNKWGMVRQESRASGDNCTTSEEEQNDEQLRNAYTKNMTEAYNRWNEIHDSGSGGSRNANGKTISKNEYKAMNPRNESEEERMIRMAMQNSMRDLDKNNHAPRLAAVGEDENLIDFGEDTVHDLSRGVSQIAFSQQMPSDVSVLGDDDATVASFMMPVQQPGGFRRQQQQYQQQPLYPPTNNQPYQQTMYQQAPPIYSGFQDPTFNMPSPTTPRPTLFNDAASFAYAPPPTWDDYKDAFGGSVRMGAGASVIGGSTVMSNSVMSPMSAASPVNGSATSFVPQQQQQQQQFQQSYTGFAGNVQAPNPFGSSYQKPTASNTGKNSMFDPLRIDPFAS